MPAKLKVFRTAIGFHDAYVAAPSQKAALEAWGTDKPLFARGAAEIVTDPALTAEPLAAPGTVVKRLRGTAEEQVAALPPDAPRPKRKAMPAAPSAPRPPKPSRADLDAAEAAVTAAEARQRKEREAIERKEQALRDERRALDRKQADESRRLEAEREDAADAYKEAMQRWQS